MRRYGRKVEKKKVRMLGREKAENSGGEEKRTGEQRGRGKGEIGMEKERRE